MGSHSLTHWINDGLMAIFFLLIGLELEREIYIGELADLKNRIAPDFWCAWWYDCSRSPIHFV